MEDALLHLHFNPVVFKKETRPSADPTRDEEVVKSKQVDIALTTDMLSQAFVGNYDVAVLVTGDKDSIPLVREVKRLGKRVHL